MADLFQIVCGLGLGRRACTITGVVPFILPMLYNLYCTSVPMSAGINLLVDCVYNNCVGLTRDIA